MKKKFKKVIGVIALIIGIVGLAFPLIPGWGLIITGLALI
jgi:uncharacterized protein YqgC (DUF456 family)